MFLKRELIGILVQLVAELPTGEFKWKFTSHRNFIVKTAYVAVMEQIEGTGRDVWMEIWKISGLL